MRNIYLIILVILAGAIVPAKAQTSLELTYDNAGNRIKRQIVTILIARDTISKGDTLAVLNPDLLHYKDSVEENMDRKTNETLLAREGVVSVYPNPTSDFIKIRFNDIDVRDYAVVLYDMNGRIIQLATYSGNQNDMDISHLNTAHYFLEIRTDAEKFIWQIIKQ